LRKTDRNPDALEAATNGWSELFAAHGQSLLETRLPEWLYRQRWFGAKTRKIKKLKILRWVELPSPAAARAGFPESSELALDPSVPPALFYFEVSYNDGASDVYQVPLALSKADSAESIQVRHPGATIAKLAQPDGEAVLFDAGVSEGLRQTLLHLIEHDATFKLFSTKNPSASGVLTAHASTAFAPVRGTQHLPGRLGSAEQSNTSILYGNKLILKLFRRLQPGENPDVEIGRFLTEAASFPHIAPFLGEIAITPAGGEKTTIAMLQGLVPNKGDGWEWFANRLGLFFQAVATLPAPMEVPAAGFLSENKVPPELRQHCGEALGAAALLGQRTAELHLALAVPTRDAAFSAELLSTEDLSRDSLRIQAQIDSAIGALKASLNTVPAEAVAEAATLLSRHRQLLDRARDLTRGEASGKRIRIHGDYHLGQTLRIAPGSSNSNPSAPEAEGDFVLLDFEGEPARPLAERRRKESPLRDVAGMLRSFSYAAHSALVKFTAGQESDSESSLRAWARLWENAACSEFLRAYRATISADPTLLPPSERAQTLLAAYVLEKALYELLYELNNRPTWLGIPLAGILTM
jgi:maltose alpha-D-glucosyltransferase/alpha-amylase